ncbi:MAG TPA: FAD-binding oxidoreductase [Chloroflexota bacterium]|nr:FAD-binding oxidoreductase [Chloroflexota bacterium]
MNRSSLFDRLAACVGRERVTAEGRRLRLYRGGPWGAGDPEGRFGRTPLLAVRPAGAEQVAACLGAITAAGHPAIALGGGTGLTGAGLPTAETVVVDLSDLDAVEIDRPSRRARVGAGVKLARLDAAAAAAGLLFAHDPWSQPLASVGGAIATNGVGYLAAGYGPMGAQVLGLQVALADGALVDLPDPLTSSTGPDLSRLFVGTEGTLGVVTAATVRLFARPERDLMAGFVFASFAEGFAALQEAADLGLRLAMIDFEEEDQGGPAELVVAVHGIAGASEATLERLAALAAARGAGRMGDQDVRRFWRERHASAEHFARDLAAYRAELLASDDGPPVGRARPGGWRYVHVALPAGAVIDYLASARARAAERRVELRGAGIWGAPELLSFILAGPPRATEALADDLLLEAAGRGGSIEYCHGVGLRLGRLMPRALGPAFPLLRRIKRALDPSDLLNPGKQGLASDGGAHADPNQP